MEFGLWLEMRLRIKRDRDLKAVKMPEARLTRSGGMMQMERFPLSASITDPLGSHLLPDPISSVW